MVLFACPWRDNRATGGFRYNRMIAERTTSKELRYLLVGQPGGSGVSGGGRGVSDGGSGVSGGGRGVSDSRGGGGTPDLVVLDSLFFLDPAAGLEIVREAGTSYGLLVHYLPSADPTSSSAERRNLAACENDLLSGAVGAVVTGSKTAEALRGRREGIPVDPVPPGRPDITALRGEKDAAGGTSLVTVSNLIPLKGIDRLVPVLAGLGRMKWNWTVYGDTGVDPAYTRRVRRTIAAAGLTDRIRLAGPIGPKEIPGALETADAFVFPSLSESYGMAAAEALAAGVPVVMNDTGEAERLIENGKEGFVCPLRGGDLDKKAWEDSLNRIIGDRVLRGRMARAASLRAAGLPSWDDTAVRFMEAVRSWMG